jgi:hypothetical protein
MGVACIGKTTYLERSSLTIPRTKSLPLCKIFQPQVTNSAILGLSFFCVERVHFGEGTQGKLVLVRSRVLSYLISPEFHLFEKVPVRPSFSRKDVSQFIDSTRHFTRGVAHVNPKSLMIVLTST